MGYGGLKGTRFSRYSPSIGRIVLAEATSEAVDSSSVPPVPDQTVPVDVAQNANTGGDANSNAGGNSANANPNAGQGQPASVNGTFKIFVVGQDGKPLLDEAGNSLGVSVQIDYKSGEPSVVAEVFGELLGYQLTPKMLGKAIVTVTAVPDGYMVPNPAEVVIKPKHDNVLTIKVEKKQVAATVAVSSGVAVTVAAAALGVL